MNKPLRLVVLDQNELGTPGLPESVVPDMMRMGFAVQVGWKIHMFESVYRNTCVVDINRIYHSRVIETKEPDPFFLHPDV